MTQLRIIYSNARLFVIFGIFNLMLLGFLLALIILLFNEVYIVSRTIFVLFVGLQTFLVFFVQLHYLKVTWDDDAQLIDFRYNKKFGLRWRQNTTKIDLPLAQFDGYRLQKDNLGLCAISFFKLERKERYELGPFHIGIIYGKERKSLEETFGESL